MVSFNNLLKGTSPEIREVPSVLENLIFIFSMTHCNL